MRRCGALDGGGTGCGRSVDPAWAAGRPQLCAASAETTAAATSRTPHPAVATTRELVYAANRAGSGLYRRVAPGNLPAINDDDC